MASKGLPNQHWIQQASVPAVGIPEVSRDELERQTRGYRIPLTNVTRMANKGWLEVEQEGNTNYDIPSAEQSHALEEIRQFLEDFPTVTRKQAVAALEEAGETVVAHARSA